VAVPPFPISTAEVYRAWDRLGGPRASRRVPAPAGLAGLVGWLDNDLEPAAEHVESRLGPFRRRLETATGRPALLAGSGSSCVVVLAADDDVGSVAGAAADAGMTVHTGRTVPAGWALLGTPAGPGLTAGEGDDGCG